MGESGSLAHGWRMIEVDAEVWEAIRAAAEPFVDQAPNDVLRRILLQGPATPPTPSACSSAPVGRPGRLPGALARAIGSGALLPGDVLVHRQPQRDRTFHATITADGWIRVPGPDPDDFSTPSAALHALTGSAFNGWLSWRVERTGRRLEAYRS